MKNLINKSIISLMFIAIIGGTVFAVAAPQVASAADLKCSSSFLTFPTWFKGLTKEEQPGGAPGDCGIINPNVLNSNPNSNDGLQKFIFQIASNIIQIGLQLVVYITIFFILFGGFKLITSSGVESSVAEARKTIANASIGLVISISAIAIVNLLAGILIGQSSTQATINGASTGIPVITADLVLRNGLNILYLLIGTLSVVMIIVSGITYVTSSGNEKSVSKAKNTILYSVIGLAVSILAFTITQFIIGSFKS